MRVEKFVNKKSQKLSDAISENFGFANYNFVQKLLREKDVKVNGKRVSQNIEIKTGDCIEFYYSETKRLIQIVFEDDDILIAFKPRRLETCSDDVSLETLQTLIQSQKNISVFAVHRIDRNTEGLVIFAKNLKAKKSLDSAIKNRKLKKYYLALVYGKVEPKNAKCEAYLKKDSEKSLVYISDDSKAGYEKIETDYKVICQGDETALVEVLLVTGKTHQIRAHFSHLGFPLVGDEKYGDSNVNRRLRKHFQCLCAYKIEFHFDDSDYLNRLDGKVIELEKEKCGFCQNL